MNPVSKTTMKRLTLAAVFFTTLYSAELPVREVVLYKHGIGFFERAGTLGPGESARLDFKTSEMNDVLKSLTIHEQGGGKISGLRYDSLDPLSRRLQEFPFRLGDGTALSSVIDQLKGARLELQLGNQTVAGAVVGGRVVAGDDKRGQQELITLLLDGGELRSFDLSAAASIRFTDPKLQQQFRDYLSALTASRSQDKRGVYIDSTDSKQRDVVASYTIPAAVWKSSYRLMMDTNTQPTLEGWAVVDNTTGEDWTKVTLALVSGRPISFITQLYPPRYVNRPGAELPEDRAAAPVLHEGAYTSNVMVAGVAGGVPGGVPGGVIGGIMSNVPSAAPPPPPPAAQRMLADRFERAEKVATSGSPSTVANTASAQEVGDLFEYRLSQPVTIRKSESAMLPFLQQKIDGRKLLIYSQRGSEHPRNAAELTNSSGKTLDGGPITVYDGGSYAGEALMETLKAGDKRLISYAVDLGTRITEAFDSKEEVVRQVHVSRGVLTARVAVEETTTYTMRNVDQKAKVVIVEHPLRKDYELLNRKPIEKTSSAYRFEVKLGAASTETFPVAEERLYNEVYEISSLAPDQLLIYVRNKNIGEAGRKQLEQIVDRKEALAEIDQQIVDLEKQIVATANDEERLRKNIESLNRVSGQQQLVQDYARKLAEQENRLATLRDSQAALQKKKSAAETEIDRLIQRLSF